MEGPHPESIAWLIFDRFYDPTYHDQLDSRMSFHAGFLDYEDAEDLASLYFIECSEQFATSGRLSLDDLTRLLSRVQKRLYRSARRISTINLDSVSLPDDRENCIDDARIVALRGILAELDLRESILFEMRFIEEQTLSKIASTLGSSTSTVHRDLEAVRRKIIAALENTQ